MKPVLRRIIITIPFVLFFYSGSLNANSGIGPTAFIENKGQILNQNNETNQDVLFLFTGNGIKLQLRKNGFSYELFSPSNTDDINKSRFEKRSEALGDVKVNVNRVDIDFYGSSARSEVRPELPNNDYLNYYVCGKEVLNVRSYNKVIYKNVFRNTDIEFILTENEFQPVKYNIILRPGSDIDSIGFEIKGASFIQKTEDGSLSMATGLGTLVEKIPFSYYADDPSKNWKVDLILSGNRISYQANYDRSKVFVIDPISNVAWSTYYGDAAIDYCNATGVDSQNNVYMGGHTLSTNNIATSGAYQFVLDGNFDAFIVKFNPYGARLWGTYFGGNNVDAVYAMHVGWSGTIFICGDTFSTSNVASFGAHQTIYGGGIDDAFLAKFNSSGQKAWSTYYGGTQHDIAQAVAVDSQSNVIITGHSESGNGIATTGAYKTQYTFGFDVFVAKFTGNGGLIWGTYYGDSGVDEAYGVTRDIYDEIYITGRTQSIAGISTGSSHQPNSGGLWDAFIAKFNPTGTNLVWGTYYGGQGDDSGTSLHLGSSGMLFLGGITTSSNSIASSAAYQPNLSSSDDAFFGCFNVGGLRQWASYFGGNDVDYVNAITTDPSGSVLLCGSTISTNSISTTGSYQFANAGTNTYDAFIAKFSAGGMKTSATYFGGASNDHARAMASDNTGQIFIAGETTSTVGIATPGSHMSIAGGQSDAFLAKFCDNSFLNCLADVDEENEEMAWSIYPNPVNNFLTVKIKSSRLINQLDIEIYSSLGELVAIETSHDALIEKNVEDLPPGIYFIKLKTGIKTFTKKFIR